MHSERIVLVEDERDLLLLLRRWEAVQRQSEELLHAYDELLLKLDPPAAEHGRHAVAGSKRRPRRSTRLRILHHPTLTGV